MRSARSFVQLTLAFVFVLAALAAPSADAQTKLLRYPDIHGDKVVFVYAGDLWTASSNGGRAERLTTHPGVELFPKFSPDGKWVAFTGQYDGDEQVYVVSSQGGVPRQLTFYPAAGPLPPRWGSDNQVYGWKPDGSGVLFRSMRYGWDLTDTQLFTVSLDGGLPTALPPVISGGGDLSPDGEKLVFSPLTRDFRTWKRYQGGWAQNLYIYDLTSGDARQITDDPRTERDPMWIGETVYFASDRTGTLNLYSYDPSTDAIAQLTDSTTWDVRWPSADGAGRIVYETAGELAIYDTRSGSTSTISINVPTDQLSKRPARISAARNVEGYGLSPKGERAVFVARGDVFTVPIENGPVRNLTRSSNAHDRDAVWSPDGSKILYISDVTGEEELWMIAQDGKGEPEQLTEDGSARRMNPLFSPDGEHVAFSDKNGKLWVLTVADRSLVEVADNPTGQMGGYSWSPHGGHLAFSLGSAAGFSSIHIWSMADKTLRQVTGPEFNEYSPAWGPNGDYLYFLADRSFAPQISSIEWNYALSRETGIYAATLRKDVKHPFPPQSDEVTVEANEDASEDEAKKEVDGGMKGKKGKKGKKNDEDSKTDDEANEKDEKTPISIDFDGLSERVARVPVPFDNYAGLTAVDGHLIYVSFKPFFYGRSSTGQPALHVFSLKDRKPKTLVDSMFGYDLSQDGKKLLINEGGQYKLYDAKPSGSGKPVSTRGLMVDRIPEQEWATAFDEVWRRFRDYFYAENMHGYDWEAIGERYRSLLPHVGHRSDLNYILGEMIAELNVSHAYVSGGDYEIPDRIEVALPGARFELDEDAGRYRIAQIYAGDNEEPDFRSPLTEIGIDASVGDYLLAIDGQEVGASDNPYRMLRYKADRPVELTLNTTASSEGAKTVTFRPVTDEDNIIYRTWVENNRRKVSEATDGKVGYIHIPDMGASGLYEFIKTFYPQIRKQGMVVDVRNNGGGNVSQMLIERFSRKLLSTGFARNQEYTDTYPNTVFTGHLVCLLNENSASDGDIFPAMFRQAGLGPLIGKRSWGGVIGISGHGPLIDGGDVRVPEFGFGGTDGEWTIEGHGVDPDIEVDNDPVSLIHGEDPQLERGISELLKQIEADPRGIPLRPADPVKTE